MPARVAQPHRMATAVPVVEIADDADAPRIGRPDGEGDAERAIMLAPMRAENGVAFVMRAFDQQVDVEIAQHRRERVDVIELVDTERTLGAQAVAKARPATEHARQEARPRGYATTRPRPRRWWRRPPRARRAPAETRARRDWHPRCACRERRRDRRGAALDDGAGAGAKRDHGHRLSSMTPSTPASGNAPPRQGVAPARSRSRKAPFRA